MERVTTYVIKVKPQVAELKIIQRLTEALKRFEWILSVEPLKNRLCFYVESVDQNEFERFMNDVKAELSRKSLATIMFSRLQTVPYNKDRKEVGDVRRAK